MINIFAIVEINGCILNLAMKNPAVIANTVVKSIHTHNANIALVAGAIPEKSKIMSKHSTCVNSVMHDNGCCNHTHTNHTSYRKVCTCQKDQTGNSKCKEHSR